MVIDNVAYAKYYHLRSHPENLKQLHVSSMLTNIWSM